MSYRSPFDGPITSNGNSRSSFRIFDLFIVFEALWDPESGSGKTFFLHAEERQHSVTQKTPKKQGSSQKWIFRLPRSISASRSKQAH